MKLQKIRDRLAEVEKQVAALESEIAQHETALAAFKSVEETVRLNDLVTARRRELELAWLNGKASRPRSKRFNRQLIDTRRLLICSSRLLCVL